MVLNDEQCARFFDTMDALLYYVNARFRVVENFTLNIAGAIDDMKASIVARTLWENVEIIDDFVKDNPAHLNSTCLQEAASWKDALPGFYTVVRYQGGRALMMGEAGVFSVSGVTEELEREIGPAPAYVDLVLLPFDGAIVYDGFLQAYSPSSDPGELQQIQDEFENRCARGIISTASAFSEVARAYLAEARSRELDALLADVAREASRGEEVLPEGFHRGVLAGLSAEERAVALVNAKPDLVAGVRAAQTVAPVAHDEGAMKVEQVLNCATSCVINRGVVALGEAYEQYRMLVADAVTPEEFEAIVTDEASYSDSYFGLWSFQSNDYLVYYTLTPDFVAQQMSRERDWHGLSAELEYYENYRRGLIKMRTEVPAKPLSRTVLENNAINEVLGDSSVLRLRDYLDERIPDGEDDFLFADRMAEDIALMSIETGSLESLFSYLHELGIDRCTADEQRFVLLVTNVFNAMPSWENNGWSAQELYEQLTGRKVFFNKDGSVMKVGADDPCPCGSGLKYRDCCGR